MKIKKILIVDDDNDIRETNKLFLEQKDYTVITAQNKEDGLRKLNEESPDLIILDIMMETTFDGLYMLDQIKAQPKYKNLGIIMQSAMQEMVGINFSHAFDDKEAYPFVKFMPKPVDLDMLFETIEELTNEHVLKGL